MSAERIDSILSLIDDVRISRISVGDHQGHHLECYSALGYMAAKTSRVALGPTVTTAAARDYAIHAAALASLDTLSGGRTFAVLGRGDGVVRNLGIRPHTVEETGESLLGIRALLRRGIHVASGREVRMCWQEDVSHRIPLAIAGSGPLMLRKAGAVADEVYVSSGITEEQINESMSCIANGAAAAGRGRIPAAWWVTPFGMAETTEEAFGIVAESLSTLGNHSLRGSHYETKGVPQNLHAALKQFHHRYDWDRKNASNGSANGALMRELGLEKYFSERFAVVGTPEQIVERLHELAGRGIRRVMLKINTRYELETLRKRVLPFVLDDL